MASSIIVEFVGIAGTGKTSIAQAVVDLLEAQGVSVGYRTKVHSKRLRRAALRRPGAALAWSYIIRRAVKDPSRRREHLRKIYNRLGRVLLLALRHQVVVMDQGIIHRFRSLRHDSGTTELSIADAAKPLSVDSLFPLEPSLLVFVESDAEIIYFRLRRRDGREVNRTSDFVQRSNNRSLRDIDQVLGAFPRAVLIRASNRFPQDIELRAAEIANRIEEMLAHRLPV